MEELGGGPFHCVAWARYRTTEPNKRPLFFAWRPPESPEPAAVAVAIETALPGPLAARSVHFDAAPATLLHFPQLAPDVERWMRSQRGIADAWLGSFDTEQPWAPNAAATRIEFHVAPASEDELLARMRKLARRSIRRAQRDGIEIDADAGRFRDFAGLYALTLERLHRVKGVPAAPVDFDALAERLTRLRNDGGARLFLATAGGAPVAGALFTMFGRRAFYLSGGANDLGRQTGAMTAVIHRAMCEFSSQGFTRINLGGVPPDAHLPSDPDHGLYAFKRGLGGVPHPCSDSRIVVRPLRSRFIEAARSTRSVVLKIAAARPLTGSGEEAR